MSNTVKRRLCDAAVVVFVLLGLFLAGGAQVPAFGDDDVAPAPVVEQPGHLIVGTPAPEGLHA